MISHRLLFGAVFAVLLIGLSLVPQISSAAQVNVSMGSNYFTPAQVTINVGDTVVWTNTDSVAHTVTADNGSFDSGTMQAAAAYARNFTAPGTYSYHCNFHNGMKGTIVVRGTQPSAYTSSPTPGYVPTSAADQLRAQAQALLAKVQQLQAQLGQGGTAAGAGGVAYDSSSCPLIGRSLKVGGSGDDVTRLQQFLARDSSIYPEGRVTGYYGALTEAAVKRWQAKYHIVSSGTPDSTGYGVVGPRTAAAIAILCTTGSYGGVPGPTGSGAPVGGFIQVTPVSGNAPLSVAVQATVNTVNSCTGAVYTLDYGDGTPPNQIAVPAGMCTQQIQTLGHVYRYGGTYLVTLSAGVHRTSAVVQVFGAGPPSVTPVPTPSPTPSSSTTWGIVSVTPAVSGNPLSVSMEIEYPACAAYSIDWGDSSLPSSASAQSGCSGDSSRATVGHAYSGSGTYTVSLKNSNGTVKATAAVSISN